MSVIRLAPESDAPRPPERDWLREVALHLAARNVLPGDTASGKEIIERAERFYEFIKRP
jgi:hypothetical protein